VTPSGIEPMTFQLVVHIPGRRMI